MSAMAESLVPHAQNEGLTQRSQRSDKVDKVLKDSKKWDGRKSIGPDNFHNSFVTLFLTFATSV
jgi:hypothetical protein